MEACDRKKLTNINTTPKTIQALEDLLKEFNIDTSEWGKVGKPVSTLLDEITHTDCYLEVVDNKLERFVDVVRIRCYHKNQQLYEEKQEFHERVKDKFRMRDLDHVGEKMKRNENPLVAAVRGLKEELQVIVYGTQLTHDSALDFTETYNPTPSYVGLHSNYRYFNYSITFDEYQYNPDGYKEISPVKTTYFVWRNIMEHDQILPGEIVGIDLDNTLLNFIAGFIEWWVDEHGIFPMLPSEQKSQDIRIDLEKLDPIYRDQANAILRERGFFSSLPLIHGAIHVLETLRKSGRNAFIITTMLHNPTEMANRMDSIRKVFGEYWGERVILTRDKTLVLADAVIDDRVVITGIADPVFEQIIFNQPYNEEDTKKQRITGWEDGWLEKLNIKVSAQFSAITYRPVVLIDISNTLALANECYVRIYRENYRNAPFIPEDALDQHSIIDAYKILDARQAELDKKRTNQQQRPKISHARNMEKTIQHPDIYNTMKPAPGVIFQNKHGEWTNILQAIEDAGYTVKILTRNFRNGAALVGKLQWVQRVLGQKWMDNTIVCRDKSLISGDILVDDAPVLKGCSRKPTHAHILPDQPYNKHIVDKARIVGWSNWESIFHNTLYSSYKK